MVPESMVQVTVVCKLSPVKYHSEKNILEGSGETFIPVLIYSFGASAMISCVPSPSLLLFQELCWPYLVQLFRALP